MNCNVVEIFTVMGSGLIVLCLLIWFIVDIIARCIDYFQTLGSLRKVAKQKDDKIKRLMENNQYLKNEIKNLRKWAYETKN